MNFFRLQNQLINLQFFLVLIISVNFLLFFNSSCGSLLNQKNYNQCIDKIEQERQKVRQGNGYSYKAQSFEECRAPVRYTLDSE